MDENEILKNMHDAVVEGEKEEVIKWANTAIAEGVNPVEAIQQGLTPAITKVGDGFAVGRIFLPELVMCAEAMKAGSSILEEEIVRQGLEGKASLGRIVIGTVAGDVHDIGKSLVSTILTAEGFDVIDLGTNVSSEQFIAVTKDKSPDIIGLSALLTTTIREQRHVIEALVESGLRDQVKVIVGGGAVTPEFAENIGADGYGADPIEAVRLAKAIVQAD
jgi:corrinoid protein of di/trimethylamine methyltransferase